VRVHLGGERGEIGLKPTERLPVLLGELEARCLQVRGSLEHLEKARTDLIDAVVLPGPYVEQDGLAREGARNDVGRDGHPLKAQLGPAWDMVAHARTVPRGRVRLASMGGLPAKVDRRLEGEQLGIEATLHQQLLVRTSLDDAAVAKHIDPVCHAHT